MQYGNSAEGPLNPGLVFDMLQAHQRTAALKAAIDLDVFRAVGEGPGDVASIARHCSASERGIRILCDFLAINGVLAKEDGRYRHTPTSAAFLDPRSPSCMASIAQFLASRSFARPTTIWRKSCAPAAPSCREKAPWSRKIRFGSCLPRTWRP